MYPPFCWTIRNKHGRFEIYKLGNRFIVEEWHTEGEGPFRWEGPDLETLLQKIYHEQEEFNKIKDLEEYDCGD
jgi:hypothetical protein